MHELVGREHRRVDGLVEIEVVVHRVEIRVGRERAEVAERAQLTHRVAARRADEQRQERHALGLVEPAGDAEVHEHGAAVGLHHQVAAVQVAVEDAVQHRAFHEPDEPGVQHRLGVDAGVVHRGDVVPRDAAQALHHEHAPRHQCAGAGAGTSSAR